ncbi:MAG TPA: response regulator transcription factor [Anaerolineales bacterium]|nr:response regulator transcription factor [Anaerolineales bacterium]HNB36885.1 response regulator transcription factor [Anaerolineales bacterium]HNC07955.1 response regulator transcription factor [Anaerolineales bacterium]
MSEIIRILIVDDHAVVRKGLAMVLRLEADFEVVGEAENGRAGLEAARNLIPDLVLVDLIMPEMDGQEMALALRKENPGIKIMMLTGTQVDDRVYSLVAAGIEGYVLKNIEPAELVRAIHAIHHGEAYLHPDVMKQVLNRMQPQSPPPITLTPRELEVLEMMATPNTYRQIAVQFGVSEETVRSHAKNILEKMHQPNRAQAVLAAMKMKWIK